MIETLVKPQSLENDNAVIQILQLLGQLSPSDLAYVLKVTAQVYMAVSDIPNTKGTE
ncbi:MAG: hypothetical protein WCK82_14135 [Bacteroidota bacterium]|jgi:hypothetical protein